MGRAATCSSSSSSNIDSCCSNHSHWPDRDLTTDLRLGLSISASTDDHHHQRHNACFIDNPCSSSRAEENQYYSSGQLDAWVTGKDETNELMESGNGECDENRNNDTDGNGCRSGNGNGRMYVKVYMEGHPIGRKLNVLAHDGYQHLISTLDQMFNTNILWGAEVDETLTHMIHNCDDFHVLTYEDEEGDWMMVGDVPWEMFLTTVRRLKITRACPC